MEEYWKGGVSALLSQGRASSSIVNRDDISPTAKKKGNVQASQFEKEAVQSGKSSGRNEISSKKKLKRENKKKTIDSDVTEEESCNVSENFRPNKMKRSVGEFQSAENDSSNALIDNGKQQVQIRKTDSLQSTVSLERQSEQSSNLKNINKDDNYSKRTSKRKNKITGDNVDKSSHTVFVGNLPLTYSHKKVVKLFNKFGIVENARIRCVPVANEKIKKKTSAITKKFHPNRNSAVAYVVFRDRESVDKAIAQNGMILNGHHLRIDNCVSQKRDSKKSIFVGGLPFDVEDDDLWDFFKDCGEIDGVRIIRDEKLSMGKGFGYVNFKSSASVELALKLNGYEIKNRKINVERCVRSKKHKSSANSMAYNKRVKRKGEKLQSALAKRKYKQNSSRDVDFQGQRAEKKCKKKKTGLTKDAARKKQIKSSFGVS